jgi:hypothetical protein
MAASTLGGWTNENPFLNNNQEVDDLPNGHVDHVVPNQHATNDLTDKIEESHTPVGNPDDETALNSHAVDPVPPFEDPALPLNSRDVCAFIVNKMIGTGIFTTPPTVLLLTRSKGEAIGLWILGFIYTLTRFVRWLQPPPTSLKLTIVVLSQHGPIPRICSKIASHRW